jgi:hypothetical protein
MHSKLSRDRQGAVTGSTLYANCEIALAAHVFDGVRIS